MRRSVLLLGVAALLVGACGGAATPDTAASPTTTVVPGTEALDTTGSSGESTTSTSGSPTTTVDPDAVIAPDFTLALADGSSFTLSEEAKPVFMVFWAEW